jgi:hypothetical protein
MPEITANRVEMTLPINEIELIKLLFSRFGKEEIANLGIHPANSVIRDLTLTPTSSGVRCDFRICCLSLLNVEDKLNNVSSERVDHAHKTDKETTGNVEPCHSDCGSCPETALRIKKSSNNSNSSNSKVSLDTLVNEVPTTNIEGNIK